MLGCTPSNPRVDGFVLGGLVKRRVVLTPPKPGEFTPVKVTRNRTAVKDDGFCPVPIEVRNERREACSNCDQLGVREGCKTFCERKAANKRPESACPIGKFGPYIAVAKDQPRIEANHGATQGHG